jgi:opacity protein-like surface antigen
VTHRTLQQWSTGGLTIVMLCWSVPVALAASRPGDTELFVSAGGQHDGAQISVFGVELIPKPGRLSGTSLFAGLTLDHQLTEHVGLELDGGYSPRLGDPHTASVTTATAGLLYNVNPSDRGVLYFVAGGGAAWFHALDKGASNNTTGTAMGGIGVNIDLKSNILLRFDFRYYYAPSPFTDQNMLQRATVGLGTRF